MCRLIDADEMIKRLQEWNTKDAMDTALFNFALHRILEQPTAYDVDEVVEQLEIYSNKDEAEQLGTIPVVELEDAFKIVKGGGIYE